MHDLILWLASRLTETPQTIEQLDKAYQAIEVGDDIACLNALTKSIDKVEKTEPLPYKYQQTVEQICDKAIEILESKTQHGGADPVSLLPALTASYPESVGIITGISVGSGIALIGLIALIAWIIRWRRRRQPGEPNASPLQHGNLSPESPSKSYEWADPLYVPKDKNKYDALYMPSKTIVPAGAYQQIPKSISPLDAPSAIPELAGIIGSPRGSWRQGTPYVKLSTDDLYRPARVPIVGAYQPATASNYADAGQREQREQHGYATLPSTNKPRW